MTDKQILDCEYLIKINEMRTCKALNVSFYGDIICRDCIILKLKKQLKRKEKENKALREEKAYTDMACELLQKQLKCKEQKLKKIEEFRHNYCMNCEDLSRPSHSCKGCNMVELKRIIEGKENG